METGNYILTVATIMGMGTIAGLLIYAVNELFPPKESEGEADCPDVEK